MATFLSQNIIFCPRCQTELEHQASSAECPSCGFTYYLNPAPATVVMIHQQGKILLAKRALEPRRGYWDLPGGFISPGETAEAGAIREAKEETGLNVEITKYLGSAPDIYGDTLTPTLVLIFTATVVSGEILAQDDVGELKWFDLEQLPNEFAFPSIATSIELLRTTLTTKQ